MGRLSVSLSVQMSGLFAGLCYTRASLVTLSDYPYDVSADGQRFLVNTLIGETPAAAITPIVNWRSGLKK